MFVTKLLYQAKCSEYDNILEHNKVLVRALIFLMSKVSAKDRRIADDVLKGKSDAFSEPGLPPIGKMYVYRNTHSGEVVLSASRDHINIPRASLGDIGSAWELIGTMDLTKNSGNV